MCGQILALIPALCDGVHCKNLAPGREKLRSLGGPFWSASKQLTYLIPKIIVESVFGKKQEVISTSGEIFSHCHTLLNNHRVL